MDGEKLKAAATWDIADVIAKTLNIKKEVAINLISMLEREECTIPFIARYRRERTGGMDPDTLRNFSSLLEELRSVQKKSKSAIKTLEKQGVLDSKTEISLLSAQSMEELDLAYAPFKGEKKTSLANRARQIGLGEAATSVLSKPNQTDLRKWVVKGTEGRATLSDVETGVKHVVADILSKEKVMMDKVREIFRPRSLTLESKLVVKKKKQDDENDDKTALNEQHKYEIYFDFSCCVNNLRSHQVLAINRGEAQKILTVKIMVSKDVESRFLSWSRKYWLGKISKQDSYDLMKSCVEDSYTRLIKPFVMRKARSDLLKKAQLEAVEIFSKNLKRLLLTPPLRGKTVLGVDPGFKNGCKCAIISTTGNEVLATDIIYLNTIRRLYSKHKFDVIGIGNGTACRETESLFSEFISKYRDLDLAYCIVNENGASIYSVTPEAQEELPGLDPNLRSAVSIARRLQDPLIELVKIEPKHMGVGMYQHDIPENHLKTALDNVLEDCVTYVGVDLNVANEALLSRIAGLKKSQAKNIVERRQAEGNFLNRQQLLDVKGIGAKTFQQCAGFIRICHKHLEVLPKEELEPESETKLVAVGSKRKMKVTSKTRSKKIKLNQSPNPLDQTWIHPESYEIAERFISSLNLKVEDLGQRDFIDSVKRSMYEIGLSKIAENLSTDIPTIQLIADGLSQEAGFRDIRNEMRRPIFRRGITSLGSLRVGTKLSGRVTNVTNFGAFVDIGVGVDGLMHQSDSGGNWEDLKRSLGPNDTVQVSVKHVDLQRKRVALRLMQADLCQTAFR